MKHGKERHEDILAKRKLGEATKKVGENIEKKKTTRESKELKDLKEKKAQQEQQDQKKVKDL